MSFGRHFRRHLSGLPLAESSDLFHRTSARHVQLRHWSQRRFRVRDRTKGTLKRGPRLIVRRWDSAQSLNVDQIHGQSETERYCKNGREIDEEASRFECSGFELRASAAIALQTGKH